MITAYRCHVHPMANGETLREIMAELCGKATELLTDLRWFLCTFSQKSIDLEVTELPGGRSIRAGIAFCR